MDKRMRHISQDILNGRQTEENIPMLLNHMANQYHTYAGVRLALHYYAFYETYTDDENTWSADALRMIGQLNHIICDHILGKKEKDFEKAVSEADMIRKEIMEKMKILTTYTDIFQIYEYVLNRVEYRFHEENEPIDEEEFAKEALRYIFDSSDNYIINEKIKEMVGQLPIRMTKQKFFDRLEESFQIYLGAEKSSLDSYLYMLRTSAMLQKEQGMEAAYPVLWEKKEMLSNLQYKNFTQPEYEEAVRSLKLATLILETETTVYYSLQEIVNEVYTMLLSSSYAGVGDLYLEEQETAVLNILTGINQLFIDDKKEELPLELMEQFAFIEGIQEELSEELIRLEEPLYEIDRNYRDLTQSLMIEKLLNVMLLSKDLLSNSLFIDFDEVKYNEIVDETKLVEEVQSLIKEYSELFSSCDKTVSRAIMANTLGKLPVFFSNHTEVMEYVRYSLERCTDLNEKRACIEIIKGIMSE